MLAVGLVLVIACANEPAVARACGGSQRETAIRRALAPAAAVSSASSLLKASSSACRRGVRLFFTVGADAAASTFDLRPNRTTLIYVWTRGHGLTAVIELFTAFWRSGPGVARDARQPGPGYKGVLADGRRRRWDGRDVLVVGNGEDRAARDGWTGFGALCRAEADVGLRPTGCDRVGRQRHVAVHARAQPELWSESASVQPSRRESVALASRLPFCSFKSLYDRVPRHQRDADDDG